MAVSQQLFQSGRHNRISKDDITTHPPLIWLATKSIPRRVCWVAWSANDNTHRGWNISNRLDGVQRHRPKKQVNDRERDSGTSVCTDRHWLRNHNQEDPNPTRGDNIVIPWWRRESSWLWSQLSVLSDRVEDSGRAPWYRDTSLPNR